MGFLRKNYKQVEAPPIQQAVKNTNAIIVSAEMSSDGEYIYKVVTNFQLNLGNCNISN